MVLVVVWAILIAGFLMGWVLRVLLGRRRDEAAKEDRLSVETSERPAEIDLTETPARRDGNGRDDGEALR